MIPVLNPLLGIHLLALLSGIQSILALAAETPTSPVVLIQSDSCEKKTFNHPLKSTPPVFSAFNPKRDHYGTDFASKGEDVQSISNGKIEVIGWDLRPLEIPNARTGLKARGWGRYIVIRHTDGSESLYAHLEPDSTKSLKVGQELKAGDVIGKSDTSGGVTGPHLHFEYSPAGNIYKKKTKVDPSSCLAVNSTFSLDTYWQDGDGIFQVFIGNQLVGENPAGKMGQFFVTLKPGKYPLRIVAKQVKKYRAVYFSVALGERLTILNTAGAEIGPRMSEEVEEGKIVERILLVQ